MFHSDSHPQPRALSLCFSCSCVAQLKPKQEKPGPASQTGAGRAPSTARALLCSLGWCSTLSRCDGAVQGPALGLSFGLFLKEREICVTGIICLWWCVFFFLGVSSFMEQLNCEPCWRRGQSLLWAICRRAAGGEHRRQSLGEGVL